MVTIKKSSYKTMLAFYCKAQDSNQAFIPPCLRSRPELMVPTLSGRTLHDLRNR
jgi:hypothetical protein